MVALILTTLSLWAVFFILFSLISNRKTAVQNRLDTFVDAAANIETVKEEEPSTFGERVIMPAMAAIYRFVARISPKAMQESTENRLRLIGRTSPHAVQQWIALRVVLGGILPILIGLLAYRLGVEGSRAIFAGLLPMALVQMMLSMYLIRAVQTRKNSIEKQLPDVLDIVTVSVEAGLSFDGALERVVQKMNTQLSDELATTLKEMRMGKLRRQALKDLSERCQVADLTTWVGAMIQADELGVGIGKVLRVQSVQMREKRRQRAQEKSMKAPVKMMFPLVFFIFPTIFVVLLGPAVIKVAQTLMK